MGTVLANRYVLGETLGEGGMGRVYRALDRELEEEVALKLLHARQRDPVLALALLRREVRLARRVTHTNVARTFDLGVHGDARFITMELVRGEPLAKRIGGARRLALPEALRVAAGIARGLVDRRSKTARPCHLRKSASRRTPSGSSTAI